MDRAGGALDRFDDLLAHLATVHPSRYGALLDGVDAVGWQGVHPISDQNVALRLVVLADRLYDRDVPVFASGTPLGDLFTPGPDARGLPQEVLPGGVPADRAGPRGRRRGRARAGVVPRSPPWPRARRRPRGIRQRQGRRGGKGAGRRRQGGRPADRRRRAAEVADGSADTSFTVALRAGQGFVLSALDPRSTPGFSGGKAEAAALMASTDHELDDLQERLYAESRTGGNARDPVGGAGDGHLRQGRDHAPRRGVGRPAGGALHRLQGARPRRRRPTPSCGGSATRCRTPARSGCSTVRTTRTC